MNNDIFKIETTLPPRKNLSGDKLRAKTYIKRAFAEPYVCKMCNRAWQHSGATIMYMEYLDNFPKLGCSLKTCKRCSS